MMRLQVILIAMVAGLSAVLTGAAERPQHNFLFIVDSSSSMTRHKTAAIRLVREVIASGFEQQIESGDSIDIWTYDTENNLRGFPPQIWQPSQTQRISDEAARYLEKYPFKAKSDFANVATDLNLLVPEARALLIVVITDGESPFSGIPLDLDINGFLAKKGKLGPGQDPFLISMAAFNGRLRTWTAHFGKGTPDLATLPERAGGSVAKSKAAATNSIAQTRPQAPAAAPKANLPAARRQHEPVASPLTASPNTDFVFNFPPGTKITPIEPATAKKAPGDKPLAVAVAERLNKLAVASSNAVPGPSTVANAALIPVPPKSNAAPVQPPLTASSSRNEAQTTNVVGPSTPTSSEAIQIAATKPAVTNRPIASTATSNAVSDSTEVIVAKTTNTTAKNLVNVTSTNVSLPALAKTDAKESTSLGALAKPHPQQTLRVAIYGSGITGLGCMMLGGYVVYRRFRRPSQSIISRSLLQR